MIAPIRKTVTSDSPRIPASSVTELRAEQEEDHRVEEEHDEIPHGANLQSRCRSDRDGQILLHVQSAGDDGEHRRHVERFRGQPRDVGRGEREQRFGERVPS